MDIKEALLEEHSKRQTEIVAAYVGNDPSRFDNLIELVFADDEIVARRAAWIMSTCCEEHGNLAIRHIDRLIKHLEVKTIHPAIKRNVIRILQTVPIPDELIGTIFNLCFNFLNDPDETIAVRAYSMTVLTRICENEPELADEVTLLVEQHLPFGSAGYKARAKNVLKNLKRIKGK